MSAKESFESQSDRWTADIIMFFLFLPLLSFSVGFGHQAIAAANGYPESMRPLNTFLFNVAVWSIFAGFPAAVVSGIVYFILTILRDGERKVSWL